MKRSIRTIRRMFNRKYWERPAAPITYASQVVTDEEVEQFIANFAATGFYDDAAGKLVSASRERRESACDWVACGTEMDPAARSEFFTWARDTTQSTMYGALAPADKCPPILSNQTQKE
jgi:hypothetical protein